MEEQLYYDIYQYLDNFIIPEEYNEKQQNRVIQTAKHYYIQNNKLYCKNKDNIQQRVITPNTLKLFFLICTKIWLEHT